MHKGQDILNTDPKFLIDKDSVIRKLQDELRRKTIKFNDAYKRFKELRLEKIKAWNKIQETEGDAEVEAERKGKHSASKRKVGEETGSSPKRVKQDEETTTTVSLAPRSSNTSTEDSSPAITPPPTTTNSSNPSQQENFDLKVANIVCTEDVPRAGRLLSESDRKLSVERQRTKELKAENQRLKEARALKSFANQPPIRQGGVEYKELLKHSQIVFGNSRFMEESYLLTIMPFLRKHFCGPFEKLGGYFPKAKIIFGLCIRKMCLAWIRAMIGECKNRFSKNHVFFFGD
ncbi:hypothetical protein CAEBREN_06884 [Caenorhabditis brenneri]|uniref:Uncharacterized protein n=1 Tax=Caenorhabditis brenneri TaxID=135651 RepID=G0NV21_CAEBE|nr:hypothetical protein CAEBREN_06884 [Caenorhabditis brenneri]